MHTWSSDVKNSAVDSLFYAVILDNVSIGSIYLSELSPEYWCKPAFPWPDGSIIGLCTCVVQSGWHCRSDGPSSCCRMLSFASCSISAWCWRECEWCYIRVWGLCSCYLLYGERKEEWERERRGWTGIKRDAGLQDRKGRVKFSQFLLAYDLCLQV